MSQKSVGKQGLWLAGLVLFMVLLSFASVPLYKIFCQKTGFGGTPQLALENDSAILDHEVTVRFNTQVHPDLRWSFEPLQREMTVKVGETGLAFYRMKNLTDKPLVGIATYNVTPDKCAPYFVKIECFCFEEQWLSPHEEVDMPLQFYIDPEWVSDRRVSDLKSLTLSYTFFNAKDPNILQKLGLPTLRDLQNKGH